MFRRIRKTEPVAVEPVTAEPAATEPNPGPSAAAARAIAPPRSSSKLGIVLGLLQSPEGASLAKLVAVTDWQPHTTRAVLTGLRKRGYDITSDKILAADGATSSVYRIAAGQAQ